MRYNRKRFQLQNREENCKLTFAKALCEFTPDNLCSEFQLDDRDRQSQSQSLLTQCGGEADIRILFETALNNLVTNPTLQVEN